MRKTCFKICVIGSLMLAFAGCQSSPTPPSTHSSAIPVQVVESTEKDITLYMEAIGTLEASQAYEVRPNVTGTIDEIYVNEGTWIKKGDSLFKIDARSYANQMQQAEAQLAMDKAAAVAADQKIERLRGLAKKDLIPQIEWEGTQATALAADALLKLDLAKLASAELDLENCTIKATGQGRIGKINTYPGAFVTEAQTQPLAVISEMNPLVVEFTISENDFVDFNKDTTEIALEPLCSNQIDIKGKIFFIDNAFDTTSGQLIVRATVPNENICLRPGQSVRVKIATKFMPNRITIPQKAVKYDSSGPYAYVIENDTAILRHLILGEEHNDEIIINTGISLGEKVVTVGHLRLSDFAKVEIKP